MPRISGFDTSVNSWGNYDGECGCPECLADDDQSLADRVQYVACERCGGTGEVEVAPIIGPYDDPTPCAEICSACEGAGRFCIEPDEAPTKQSEPEIIF